MIYEEYNEDTTAAQQYLENLRKKINQRVKNPFDLPMSTFQFQQLNGWKNATVQLDTSTKIYGLRVDFFYEDVSKTVGNILRNGQEQLEPNAKQIIKRQEVLRRQSDIEIGKHLQTPEDLKSIQLADKDWDPLLWKAIYERCDNISQLMMNRNPICSDLNMNLVPNRSFQNIQQILSEVTAPIQDLYTLFKEIQTKQLGFFKQLSEFQIQIKNKMVQGMKQQYRHKSNITDYQITSFQGCLEPDIEDQDFTSIFNQDQFLSDAFRHPEQFFNFNPQQQDIKERHCLKAIGMKLKIDHQQEQLSQQDQQQIANIPTKPQNDDLRQFVPFLYSDNRKQKKTHKKQNKGGKSSHEIRKKKYQKEQAVIEFNRQLESRSKVLNPCDWICLHRGSKWKLVPIDLDVGFPLRHIFRKNQKQPLKTKLNKGMNQFGRSEPLQKESAVGGYLNEGNLDSTYQQNYIVDSLAYETHPEFVGVLGRNSMNNIKGMIKGQIVENHRNSFKQIQENNHQVDPLDIFASLLHLAYENSFLIVRRMEDLIIFEEDFA